MNDEQNLVEFEKVKEKVSLSILIAFPPSRMTALTSNLYSTAKKIQDLRWAMSEKWDEMMKKIRVQNRDVHEPTGK